MSTIESETIPGALTVIRSGIDRSLALDMAEECGMLLGRFIDTDGVPSTAAPDSSGLVYTKVFRGDQAFRRMGFSAITRVAELIGGNSTDGYAINEQAPGAQQKFHPDIGKVSPVRIVHGSDDGRFDFTTEKPNNRDEYDYVQTVELSAGDILLLHNPAMLHRGRSASDDFRITFAKYRTD